MKLSFYNTPNSFWYFGKDYNKEYGYLYIYFFGKSIGFHWGKKIQNISLNKGK